MFLFWTTVKRFSCKTVDSLLGPWTHRTFWPVNQSQPWFYKWSWFILKRAALCSNKEYLTCWGYSRFNIYFKTHLCFWICSSPLTEFLLCGSDPLPDPVSSLRRFSEFCRFLLTSRSFADLQQEGGARWWRRRGSVHRTGLQETLILRSETAPSCRWVRFSSRSP